MPKWLLERNKILESIPNNLIDIIEYLDKSILNTSEKISKTPVLNVERKAVVECILFVIDSYPLLLEKTIKSELITSVLNIKASSKASSKYQPKRSEVIISDRLVSFLLIQIVKASEIDEQK